jgi:cholesterol oxidase
MQRLSKPLTQLKPSYEVVVIGSGYGGSIAASRMSRAGMKVCLLEKGKEFLPGEFPSKLTEAGKEMHVKKGKTHLGPENGLYEFVVNEDINVFKGCGLGGTSLVNANVSIEAEDRIFEDTVWPEALRNNMDSLKEGIFRAREMLEPKQYPEGINGYPFLAKTQAMRISASAMKEEFRLLDINVNFEDKINKVGVAQHKCANCGDCVTGCNHAAKNTTHMNYLPDAVNHGADIFCEAGVSYIERSGNQWLVHFDVYNTGREKFYPPALFVKADKVIVSAGSLGSTEILLRSAAKGLPVSNKLGERFTGNGDVLGFGYNNEPQIHGIGLGDKLLNGNIAKVGPCITSVIDMRHKEKLEDGMTLEEGSIPGPIRTILVPALLPLARIIGKNTDAGFSDFIREKWREIISLFRGPFKGAIDHTQVYLVMSHDDDNGKMELKDNVLSIKWKGAGKQDIFKKVSDKLQSASKALGGNYIKNPTWTKALNYDLVTVHPLGGCPMAEDASLGVVDHKGQVFAGTTGTRLHPGLYVMDGAIIPRSLGTNPLLTISGLAERNCKIIIDEAKANLKYDYPSFYIKENAKPNTGIQFTESMTGYFSSNEKEDYTKARDLGKKENSPFRFVLTIQSQDIDAFIEDPNHKAGMFGTIVAPALSPDPLTISEGSFYLFVPDKLNDHRKEMRYAMLLNTTEGKSYYFKGFKDIADNKGFDLWSDTTVLYVTIFNGPDENSPVLGKGMLKIEAKDFAMQLRTMKAVHAKTNADKIKAITKFGKLFIGNITDTYFKSSELKSTLAANKRN